MVYKRKTKVLPLQNGARKHCQFCTKLLPKRGLTNHEKWCAKNPNRKTSLVPNPDSKPTEPLQTLPQLVPQQSNEMLFALLHSYANGCNCVVCQYWYGVAGIRPPNTRYSRLLENKTEKDK
jgi:hypothetical protein